MSTLSASTPESNPLISALCQIIYAAQVTEYQFQQDAAFLRALRDAPPHLLLELDAEGTVLNLSRPPDFKLFRQTAGVLQRPIAELLPAEAVRNLQSAMAHALRDQKPAHCTWTLLLDQQERYFDVHVAYLRPQHMLAIVRDITVQHQAVDQLRELPRLLLKAQEQERARLSHDLHDEIGQDLTAIILAVHQAKAEVISPTQQALEQVEAELQALTRKIRRLAQDLHPATLDEFGLTAALNSLLTRFSQQLPPTLQWHLPSEEERFPRDIEVTAYRIVQESLTNILRHAQATWAKVEVYQSGQHLLLQILDNGCGFDMGTTSQAERYGLLGMSERVFVVGGDIHIRSVPGQGTQISAELPLNLRHEGKATT